MARIKAFNMGLSYAITPLVGRQAWCQAGTLRRRPACHCMRSLCARPSTHSACLTPAPLPLPRVQSALAAFGVARATNPGELTVANVFYSLALVGH